MRNWTIRQKILASLALILLLMIGMGVNAILRLERVGEHVENLQLDSVLGVYYSTRLEASLLENLALTERYQGEDNKSAKAYVRELL